jgi:chromosome segregation ATPase
MSSINLLEELNQKIEQLEQSVNVLRMNLSKETSEMNELQKQLTDIKSRYDMKKLEVSRIESKIKEKSKICNEARAACDKIIDNTSKLLQAVNNEVTNNNLK